MKHANRVNILNKQFPLGIYSYILCLLCAYLIFIFQLERVYLMYVHILLTSRTPRKSYMTCIIKSRITTHANKYIHPPRTRKQCDGYQLLKIKLVIISIINLMFFREDLLLQFLLGFIQFIVYDKEIHFLKGLHQKANKPLRIFVGVYVI